MSIYQVLALCFAVVFAIGARFGWLCYRRRLERCEHASTLRADCGWCGRVMRPGYAPASGAISHGICPACTVLMQKELEREGAPALRVWE